MRKNLTEIVFILDRSGSMNGLEADTIGGFNSMIEKQKKENGEALISTVLFDNVSEVIHDRIPVQKVEPMTDKDYSVRGCTALLDAIGGAIHHIGNVHKYARKEIYKNPLHPYTKGLLSCIPIADPKLARAHASAGVEGDLPSPVNPKPGCRVCGRCPYAKPICSEQTPAMKEAAPGHFVACHLY